ncbi:MAG: biopolymer transporter ExbD [Candidatus Marinimicrobia bacterium]|nr:biopolymer transporter ExbD [Candidatus Neomarinimicrobiota bacterium]MCH8011851.1 biopolymer transporter ExbD [Candidatus Neomarinimicrobiota bacterium]MCH8067745.1 biopolymer transporter ExbD [Candidatus Neomarinimicrobiota bacterium]
MKRRMHAGVIPTASMADIAFLLLIFFLVTTTIDMDKGLGIILPPPGAEVEVSKKNISNLLINAQGKILLDNEPVQTRDIKRIVESKIAANDKLIISVKTHPRTKYQVYIDVLDQLKQAKATRISIAEPSQ